MAESTGREVPGGLVWDEADVQVSSSDRQEEGGVIANRGTLEKKWI